MKIYLVSFGISYGIVPMDQAALVSCKGIQNPDRIRGLQHLRGWDRQVYEQVLSHKKAGQIVQKVMKLVENAQNENRDRINIALYCAMGRHRSVAMVEHCAKLLREQGYTVIVTHRDANRK